jgi:hypothetical protein
MTYNLPEEAAIVRGVEVVSMCAYQLESIVAVCRAFALLARCYRTYVGLSISPVAPRVLLIVEGNQRGRGNLGHDGQAVADE